MNNDKFFKISFISTLITMAVLFYFQKTGVTFLEVQQKVISVKKDLSNIKETPALPKADIDKIKRLVSEGRLSDKEAMFYETIDNY